MKETYSICTNLNYLKMKKEYKVEVVKEGALGTIFLGSSKMPLKKMEEVMNKWWRWMGCWISVSWKKKIIISLVKRSSNNYLFKKKKLALRNIFYYKNKCGNLYYFISHEHPFKLIKGVIKRYSFLFFIQILVI